MLLVADPDISAIPLAEAVLGQVLAVFEQLDLLRLDLGKVVGMDVGPPEVGGVQILIRAIAEHVRDVGADERGRKIAGGDEAVDHRGGRTQ